MARHLLVAHAQDARLLQHGIRSKPQSGRQISTRLPALSFEYPSCDALDAAIVHAETRPNHAGPYSFLHGLMLPGFFVDSFEWHAGFREQKPPRSPKHRRVWSPVSLLQETARPCKETRSARGTPMRHSFGVSGPRRCASQVSSEKSKFQRTGFFPSCLGI